MNFPTLFSAMRKKYLIAAAQAAYKKHTPRLRVENLESREVPATLSAPVLDETSIRTISNEENNGNRDNRSFAPVIAVNPVNPDQVFVAYVKSGPFPTDYSGSGANDTRISLAFSRNGGSSYQSLSGGIEEIETTRRGNGFTANLSSDPKASDPPNNVWVPYSNVSNASVAFDRFNRVYLTYTERNADGTSGRLILRRFNMASGSPVELGEAKVLYSWVDSDKAYNPTIAIDTNLDTFVDPTVQNATGTQTDALAASQTDPNKVRVFIAWNSDNVDPTNDPRSQSFTPSVIKMIASSDGGDSFGATAVVNDSMNRSGGNWNAEFTQPKIVFTQGRAGVAGSGGKMIVMFTNSNTDIANAPQSLIADTTSFTAATVPHTVEVTNNTPKFINDATDPGNSLPHNVGTTEFDLEVPVGTTLTSIDNISLTISLMHDNLAQVQIELVSPDGQRFTLLRNGTDRSGNAVGNPQIGIAGTTLGVVKGTFNVGTIFQDNAARDIDNDSAVGSSYTGTYSPNGNQEMNEVFEDATIVGTWKVVVTDTRNSGATTAERRIRSATLRLTQNLSDGLGSDVTTGAIPVKGSMSGTAYPTASAALPAGVGIGPGVSIAVDNSLGAFSQYQGRTYVAYQSGGSIGVRFSDNGGASWSVETVVGAGYMPTITVDQTTGTVVVAYYSTQFDAAGTRSAMMISTSINGPIFNQGAPNTNKLEFSTPTYVNATEKYYDQITSTLKDFEPVTANGVNAGIEGFGNNVGLSVINGRVNLLYTGNQNSAGRQIWTQGLNIAAGPRIVSGQQGVILGSSSAEVIEQDGQNLDVIDFEPYNNTFAPNSGPRQFTGFVIEFDRPIDPSTLNPSDIEVLFRSPTANPVTGGTVINVSSIVRLDFLKDPIDGSDYGSKRFLIRIPAQSAVGTYSYAVRSDISDRIRGKSFGYVNQNTSTFFNTVDVPIVDATGPNQTPVTSTINVNTFNANQVVGDVNVTININHTNVRDLNVVLVSPSGQRITLVASSIDPDDDFKFVNYQGTTFDDSAFQNLDDDFPPFTGTFRPAEPLSTFFASQINGDWQLVVTDTNQGDIGTIDSWSIQLRAASLQSSDVSGNKMDQDGDGRENEAAVGGVEGDTFAVPNPVNGVPFQLPYAQGSLPVVISGPHIVASRVQGNPQTSNNLVLNGSVKSIDIQFDRLMNTSTFTSDDVLGFTGPLGNISVSGVKIVPITALNGATTTGNSKFYRITFSEQKLSGGYTLQLGSNIQDAAGNLIDTNHNAGVGNLKGSSTGAQVSEIPYGGTAINVAIPGQSTTTINLNVTDAYLLQRATANITVNQAKTRDLEIRLVAPDGTSVLLFNNAPSTGADSAGILNTTFADAAATPIQLGGGGFANGTYNPIQPLAQLLNRSVNGNWKLVIKNKGTVAGTVTKFGLKFDKPLVGTGLGEEVADQSSIGFRIQQTDGSTDTAKNNWTPVGPNGVSVFPEGNSNTVGRISAIAVDPTDSSGNIVYAAGASGGVWRTTNFLTKNADGPTWVPLTDFGPNNAINVGSIALYNKTTDPSKTMIIVGTGSSALNTIAEEERDDLTFNGVGLLTSDDAGKTWQVLDSNTNYSAGSYLSYSDSLRDHAFVGTVVNKIVVENELDTGSSRPIIYAAIGRGSAAAGTEGLYRSRDGGRTWAKIFTGEATDFTLAAGSVAANSSNRPTMAYLAIEGQGVFRTVNLTSGIPTFTQMNGGVGRPTVQNTSVNGNPPVNVDAPIDTPNGAKGKITLAVPAFVKADALANNYYQSWLYAAVTRTDGSLDGLYMTKDAGANWTRVKITAGGGFNDTNPDVEEIPNTNRSFIDRGGNHSLSLAVDPTNPNIVYLGSDQLIRVDTTFTNDAYNLSMYNNSNADGGQVRGTNTGSVSPVDSAVLGGGLRADNPDIPFFNLSESQTPGAAAAYAARLRANETFKWNFLNTSRDPYNPFFTNTTLFTSNVTKFNNTGNDARWVDTGVEDRFDFSFVSNIITVVDPLTGQARLIYGSDEGIDTVVFNSDASASINSVANFDDDLQVNGTRNGDIQVARLYSGDAQPSLLASSISGALFYAASHRGIDVVQADGGVLSNGNTLWENIGRSGPSNYVTTDQTGTGAVYILRRFDDIGVSTDFFQISLGGNAPISRTSGLFQSNADATGQGQWDNSVKRFAVNPIDPLGIIMGSNAGRLFGTTDQGLNWNEIASPSVLDGTMISGLAYGAPLPSSSSLNEYIYAGTEGGKIFVTTNGGGDQWTDISTGLDGSAVQKIIPNPTRGSNSAYVVTEKGVFFTTDWTQPGFTWQNITGTLLTTKSNSFGSSSYSTTLMANLSTMAVDWRPLTAPNLGLPVLYVGGDGGVFRSTDGGVSWARFPATGTSGSGGLPVVKVTDLDLSLGNINPTTGITNSNGSPDVLVATTLGRGAWVIKLAKPEGVSGPKVTASTPSTPLDGSTPFDTITVDFSGYIDPTTFTSADVTIKLPNGTIVDQSTIIVTDVTSPPVGEPNLHNKWVITFPGELAEGTYIITVGPNITDGGGTPMNQDGDKINGEATADQFKLSVVIGKNDIADYVKDVYQELLGRGPTSDEYLAKSKAIIAARLSSLGGVVTTLLRTDEARTEMINRLFTISGAFTNEIGNLIPGYTLTPTELTSYLTGLKKGTMSPESILKGILNKPEYFTHAGGTNADFVTHVYQDLLGRAPSATDLTKGTSQVGTAKGKTTFINTLVNGTEYRNRVVTMAYRKYLNDDTRVVTTAELSAGRTLIAQALAANNLQGSERVVRKILASQEYFDKQVQAEGSLPDNGLHTNRAWVASIFTNYIHRSATGAEIDTNTTTILGKMKASQTTFINSLTASAEFKEKDSTAQANLYYQQILGRAPLEAELALWIKNIKAGQRHDQQIARILGSTEFHETRAPQVVGGGASVSKETFIRAMYQVLLGRAPTEGASNAELELAKKNTGTRTAIALSLLRKATTTLTPLVPSTFAIDLIQDYYSDILGITLSDTDPLIASNMTILKNSTFLWSTVKRNILLSRDFYEVKN